MKSFASRAPRYDSGPNMTPLVDVVMVILVFLMLAGNFASGEHFLQSKTPAVSEGVATATQTPAADPGLRLDLYVRAEETGTFSARANGLGEVHDVDALASALAGQQSRYAADGVSPDKVLVVIHAAPTTTWGPLAGVYDAALRAKFKQVTFAWAK